MIINAEAPNFDAMKALRETKVYELAPFNPGFEKTQYKHQHRSLRGKGTDESIRPIEAQVVELHIDFCQAYDEIGPRAALPYFLQLKTLLVL